MAHKLFNVMDMASTDINAYKMTMTFEADVDRGALVVPGALANGSAFASVKDMDNHVGDYVAAATDEIYVVDYDGVAFAEGNGYPYHVNIADPRAVYVPAGTPTQCRRLMGGDVAMWDATWFDSTPTVGQYVAPSTTGHGWGASAASKPASGKCAMVEAARNFVVGGEYVPGYQLRIVAGN